MKLERYIKNNREEFDGLVPSEKIWKGIEKQLNEKFPQPKPSFLGNIWQTGKKYSWQMAASIVFLVGVGIWMLNHSKSNTYVGSDLASLDPNYAKQVNQYTSFISEKKKILTELEKEDPALYQQFSAEWKALDEQYGQLKADLPKNPNQEELIKAMLQNLQWQIELLNQQLEVIQNMKKAKNNEKHEMV